MGRHAALQFAPLAARPGHGLGRRTQYLYCAVAGCQRLGRPLLAPLALLELRQRALHLSVQHSGVRIALGGFHGEASRADLVPDRIEGRAPGPTRRGGQPRDLALQEYEVRRIVTKHPGVTGLVHGRMKRQHVVQHGAQAVHVLGELRRHQSRRQPLRWLVLRSPVHALQHRLTAADRAGAEHRPRPRG